MWSTLRRTATAGFILALLAGLAAAVILSAVGSPIELPADPQCQEVVVQVEDTGQVLARCPKGTSLDIVDDTVVCRCPGRRVPFHASHSPNTLPTAEPPVAPDDRHEIDL